MTTEQMIEVDRLMMEDYNIELIQMMENAGRCLAIVAKEKFLKGKKKNSKVVVLAGTGGNGGGAMVCARRLFAWGFDVEVFVTNQSKMTPVPDHQMKILKRMGVPVKDPSGLGGVTKPGLIIDGVIGYSITGDPIGTAGEMIAWANQSEAKVLSLDTPSGINLTTGTIYSPAIKAAATLTLALPKRGLYDEKVKSFRGRLFLGDISVPPSLYSESSLNLEVTSKLFSRGDIVSID